MTKKTSFTEGELIAIQVAERFSSFLSVFGSFFVMATFLKFRIFRKPINRLVFYASIGNLATNVATIISRASVVSGVRTPLCQIQAFIIQMFMPADSLWTLSMSLNVYLTFFHRYSGNQLYALERYYIAINYGVPFVPAVIYLLIEGNDRGPMYGDATLWCWITVRWNFLRIATFYGPVWIVLIATMTIYIIVGRVVFENKARFRELTSNASKNQASMAARPVTAQGSSSQGSPVKGSPAKQGPNSKTTEVNVTSHSCSSQASSTGCKRASCIVTIEAVANSDAPKADTKPKKSRRRRLLNLLKKKEKKEKSSADRAAWAYLKCALLFFTAMMVTWVPATINRVATLIDPTLVSFGLNFTEALLLPLQGFFNALIYVAISTEACAFLRVHCKRVLRRIFIEPWKYIFPCLFSPRDRQPEVSPPPKLTPGGYPMPASCGQSQMDPGRPRPTRPAPTAPTRPAARPARPIRHGHTGRPLVRSIQQHEIEEYHRLRGVLNISPDPESAASTNSNK